MMIVYATSNPTCYLYRPMVRIVMIAPKIHVGFKVKAVLGLRVRGLHPPAEALRRPCCAGIGGDSRHRSPTGEHSAQIVPSCSPPHSSGSLIAHARRFRVYGSRFTVQGGRFRLQGLGFRV